MSNRVWENPVLVHDGHGAYFFHLTVNKKRDCTTLKASDEREAFLEIENLFGLHSTDIEFIEDDSEEDTDD